MKDLLAARIAPTFAFVGLIAAAPLLHAAVGDIDTGFTGQPVAGCAESHDIVIDEAGAIFVACIATSANGENVDINAFKFLATGDVDESWAVKGRFRQNLTEIACKLVNGRCPFAHVSLARDGSLMLYLDGGSAIKILPTGVADAGYAKQVHLTLPDAARSGSWRVQGVAHQTDGGMHVLSTLHLCNSVLLSFSNFGPSVTDPCGYRTTYVIASKFRPDGQLAGRIGGDGGRNNTGGTYDQLPIENVFWSPHALVASNPILAWATDNSGVDMLVSSYLDQSHISLESSGPRRLRELTVMSGSINEQGRTLSTNQSLRYFNPSFTVLGDGKLLFSGEFNVFRWYPDKTGDAGFGFAGSTRLRDGSNFCNMPAAFPHLILRAGGEITSLTAGSDAACGTVDLRNLDANGRVTSFTSGLPLGGRPFRIDRGGGFVSVEGGRLVRRYGPGARADIKVVEYYSSELDHYFMTANEQEVEFVDRGNAGAWKRTGNVFGAWNIDAPVPGTNPVCRYYGDAVAGPNSHFYSAEAFECDGLRTLELATPAGRPAWRFERNAFLVTVPVNGPCAQTLTPVTRFYNRNLGPGREPNHRYVTRQSDIDAMTARGWVNEGVHMCATSD